jgi:SAM-dependent methyltransferase
METITDWQALWKELVEIKKESQKGSIETPGDSDYWINRAREYNERVKVKWEKPDLTRTFILTLLEPNSSIIDIGAGTGSWSILFSKYLEKVTAIEPSKAMREVFYENIQKSGIRNIEIIPEKWPESNPEPHDYVFCAHAMYGAADFSTFVQNMIDRSRKMCFLLIRAPSPDGLITEACQHIWKQPHDSPNFTIAYNILIQMGIYANVQFEESDKKFFMANSSENEAFTELKSRMGLSDNYVYDEYLKELLNRRLVKQDNQYFWPGGVQSALIYWPVKR